MINYARWLARTHRRAFFVRVPQQEVAEPNCDDQSLKGEPEHHMRIILREKPREGHAQSV